MRRVIIRFSLLLLWGCALVVTAFAAPQDRTAVSLGDVATSVPNTQVSVPLSFAPNPPHVRVGRLRATIRFENQVVSFLKAEKGITLESERGGLEVKQESDSKNAKESILRVEVSRGGGEFLREGVLAFLVFSIKEDAPVGTTVTLQLQDLEASSLDTPAHAIEPLAAKDGTIQMINQEEAPYTNCFFFTH